MTQKNQAPTILIVDDTPSNLGMVVKLMEERGYRVSIAQDGEEGLQRAQLLQPDLILLDVMMPGADGFEICRHLKKLENTRDIPVMFMTALASPEHKVKGFAAGGVDYLTKPLHVDEVMARVDTHIKLNTAQRQLAEQNALLEKQRDELEMRVGERTAELGEANRKLREESAERERAYRRMVLLDFALDHVTDDVSLLDQHGMFRYVNEHACREMGFSRSKLLNMGVPDIDPDWTSERYAAFWTELQKQGSITLETRHRTSSGKMFPVEVDANYFEYEGIGYNLTLVRDITARKAAENALRESEEKYRTLIQKIQAAVVVHGADTKILTSNPMAQQILGLTEEQLYGKSAIDPNWHFFREDGSPMPLDGYPVNKVLSTGKALRDYLLGIHRPGPGDDVWGLVNADPVFGSDGKITQVIVTFIDITQRKRAEEALVASEREFRTLAENIPDHIIRYDRNARKIYLNTATARLMGIEPGQVIGQTPEDTPNEIRAMKLDEFARRVRQVLDTGEPQEFEVALRHAQSGMQIHNVRFVAERDEQGNVVGALMVGRDITARKKMEEELREQELRYREIFDNASDGLYLLEETADGRFRNLDVNPAFLRLTGMSRKQLIGKCVDETVPPETAEIVSAKYRRCIRADAPIVEEAELDLPVGKRHFHSVLVPIRNGGPRRIVGITRDITEIKLVERSLEESRAQLRGLAAKNEAEREEERKYIARAIYDELGQTLTGLQLDVSALSHQFGQSVPALGEHLKGTQELVNKSIASLRNVAAMLRPSSLDMEIALAIEWLAGRFADNTGVACGVRLGDGVRNINPDEKISVALYRIAHELLTNISRHAKASKVDVMFDLKKGEFRLEVSDNGTGFDTNNIKEGSFGLFDIRERIHRLGGQFSINSSPGKGTKIKLSIPGK